MRIAGIIAEYNPFHNGHAWHVRQTRERTGCDYVIACMVGHFTQRGEPTCHSKWARTQMALRCGVDAVFEMPVLFAVRTADAFALGGTAILDAVGADVLSFGCENPDLDVLRALAGLRADEPQAISDRIREKLDQGMSHARARGEAMGEYLGLPRDAVNQPNLILASEYLRAIDRLHSRMEPFAIPRAGGYHDDRLGEYASASAIRAAMRRGEIDAALQAIPRCARPFAVPDAMHPMDDMLMLRLRSMTTEELAALPDVSEGLEHRVYRSCRETAGREALLDALKCRRYTRARLSRLLTHALLGVTRADLETCPLPTYARLLGVRADAGALLKELDRRAKLPVISSATALRGDDCFDLECRATDIWALLHEESALRLPGREFTEKFIKV